MLLLQPFTRRSWWVDAAAFQLHILYLLSLRLTGFSTRKLAYVLHSLVRVSRRVEENHLVSIANQEVPHAKREACSSKYAALNPNLGPTKHIHPPTGKRPCPWSLRQAWTDADTPSKKHSKSHAQNQQPHLRCDRKPSH